MWAPSSTLLMRKPTSTLGTITTRAERFPTVKSEGPGAGQYDSVTFIDLIDKRESTIGLKNYRLKAESNYPGPSTYRLNHAIGRHVANDYRFSLTNSEELKDRRTRNLLQQDHVKELLREHQVFAEKRSCRRLAYLGLYF
jgi:hypothetical protein